MSRLSLRQFLQRLQVRSVGGKGRMTTVIEGHRHSLLHAIIVQLDDC
jgi:hypothetical protein